MSCVFQLFQLAIPLQEVDTPLPGSSNPGSAVLDQDSANIPSAQTWSILAAFVFARVGLPCSSAGVPATASEMLT